MANYCFSKDVDVDSIEKIRQSALAAVENAQKIIVIGVSVPSVRDDDPVTFDILSKGKEKVIYLNPTSSEIDAYKKCNIQGSYIKKTLRAYLDDCP